MVTMMSFSSFVATPDATMVSPATTAHYITRLNHLPAAQASKLSHSWVLTKNNNIQQAPRILHDSVQPKSKLIATSLNNPFDSLSPHSETSLKIDSMLRDIALLNLKHRKSKKESLATLKLCPNAFLFLHQPNKRRPSPSKIH